jgi:phosphorylcholine metabolism protein LicD
MINHHLKIVDFYIDAGCPDKCIIEPIFGTYEPDLFFKDKNENSICVEIQLTPISHKKMQNKINQFVSEYEKEHDSKILVICSDYKYKKLTIPSGFKMIQKLTPKEFCL